MQESVIRLAETSLDLIKANNVYRTALQEATKIIATCTDQIREMGEEELRLRQEKENLEQRIEDITEAGVNVARTTTDTPRDKVRNLIQDNADLIRKVRLEKAEEETAGNKEELSETVGEIIEEAEAAKRVILRLRQEREIIEKAAIKVIMEEGLETTEDNALSLLRNTAREPDIQANARKLAEEKKEELSETSVVAEAPDGMSIKQPTDVLRNVWCPRCCNAHKTLRVGIVSGKKDLYKYWAICPVKHEPMMIPAGTGE